MDVRVTAFEIRPGIRPNRQGDRIVAYYSCEIADLATVRGAALVRLNSGRFSTWEPRLGDAETRRSVRFAPHIRAAATEAAVAVFRQFGGEARLLAAE